MRKPPRTNSWSSAMTARSSSPAASRGRARTRSRPPARSPVSSSPPKSATLRIPTGRDRRPAVVCGPTVCRGSRAPARVRSARVTLARAGPACLNVGSASWTMRWPSPTRLEQAAGPCCPRPLSSTGEAGGPNPPARRAREVGLGVGRRPRSSHGEQRCSSMKHERRLSSRRQPSPRLRSPVSRRNLLPSLDTTCSPRGPRCRAARASARPLLDDRLACAQLALLQQPWRSLVRPHPVHCSRRRP